MSTTISSAQRRKARTRSSAISLYPTPSYGFRGRLKVRTQSRVVVRDITQQPYIVYPPVTVQYVLNPWVNCPRWLAGESDQPSAGGAIQRRPVYGWPLDPGSISKPRVGRLQHHQYGGLLSKSANFLVAGMLPSSHYLMHWEELSGAQLVRSGTQLSFATGPLSATFPPDEHFTVNIPASPHDSAFPVILFHLIPAKGQTLILLADGNRCWRPCDLVLPRLRARSRVCSPAVNFFTMGFTDLTEYDLAGERGFAHQRRDSERATGGQRLPQMNSFNTITRPASAKWQHSDPGRPR